MPTRTDDQNWLDAIELANEDGTAMRAFDFMWRVNESLGRPHFKSFESFKSSLKHHAQRLGAALVLRQGRPA